MKPLRLSALSEGILSEGEMQVGSGRSTRSGRGLVMGAKVQLMNREIHNTGNAGDEQFSFASCCPLVRSGGAEYISASSRILCTQERAAQSRVGEGLASFPHAPHREKEALGLVDEIAGIPTVHHIGENLPH